MSKVTKESFFEASFQTKEEFASAEIAAGANVSDNAELKVTEIKLEKSVIKTNQEKESNDGDKEQLSVEKI